MTSASSRRYIYQFSAEKVDGSAEMKSLLGGKGANLAEMSAIGIPVPPGFTISTEACADYFKSGGKFPAGLESELRRAIARLERSTKLKFGVGADPLLLSVRSGARASMPGMMDTILNLGLNAKTVASISARSGSERFALDSYRRLIMMLSDVALGVERALFDRILEKVKRSERVKLDTDLSASALGAIVEESLALVKRETKRDFPSDPIEQLELAIDAVFRSWNNERAVAYRRLYGIPDEWGTAVNVQMMVFGNMGDDSGTGVAFTRDPSTGERRFFGEFLVNAQGEDVVAGVRTPLSIEKMGKSFPRAKRDLDRIYKKLERHYRDMLDIEFTIERGKLYMLQCRVGKRTARAAARIAVEMVRERLIDRREAVLRLDPISLDQLLHKGLDESVEFDLLTKGLPASPGACCGRVVFSAAEALEAKKKGEKVILTRKETSPDDIKGMSAAEGILTATGGMTSHAAVVARGMGAPCVSGAEEIEINEARGYFTVGSTKIKRGDLITLDGATGRVIKGAAKLVDPDLPEQFHELMKWADSFRRLKMRANADTPQDARRARERGAQGIGLCRTEHMFFEGDRISLMREVILSEDLKRRESALVRLGKLQKSDFIQIFEAMRGDPVTIRLLDPPLHEFLPREKEEFKKLGQILGEPASHIRARVEAAHEFNPMLGHRGCRLGITFPEIYDTQARAIFEAAADLIARSIPVAVEIMVPLVSSYNELRIIRSRIETIGAEVQKADSVKIPYLIGTMIELPRAALTADFIAEHADFFSFGTNDLTQTVFGFSRDDSGKFLSGYLEGALLRADPFVTIDQKGVGALMKIGVEKARAKKAGLKIGICGEHGGDPKSIEFVDGLGFDYVSCSPYRLPIARLAAAQAAIRLQNEAGPTKSVRRAKKKASGKKRSNRARARR